MHRAAICLFVCCALVVGSCQVPDGMTSQTPGQSPAGFAADGCVPADIPQEEGFVSSGDGTQLYYRKIGRGVPAAIYLHGGPGATIYNGGCEIAPLARDHSIILYDQRGGGRSQLVADPAELRVADHVADLEAVRRDFGAPKLALIGLSWGSALATYYADAHPDRVSRLLLLAPMPIAKTPFGQERSEAVDKAAGPALIETRRRLTQQMRAAVSDDEAITLCRRLQIEAPLPYTLDPARHRALTGCDFPASVIKNRATVNQATLKSMGEWDFRPSLGRVKVPVLVIEGERTVVPLSSTRLWAATPANGRLLLIPNAGHEVGMDQPEATLAAARVFLNGKWPPRSLRP